jgi:hypothetical protein
MDKRKVTQTKGEERGLTDKNHIRTFRGIEQNYKLTAKLASETHHHWLAYLVSWDIEAVAEDQHRAPASERLQRMEGEKG